MHVFSPERDLKWLCCIQRSSRGCDQLMTAHCQPIVQGITNAMSEIDEKTLVREGCQTALLALRYSGNHHRCFWFNAIDEVLYKILSGSCNSSHHAHRTLCYGQLFNIDSKDIMNIYPYVWDILGYLAVHCDNEHLSIGKRQNSFLQGLISCAWLVLGYILFECNFSRISLQCHKELYIHVRI
jgi:hypothetical protein